MANNQQPKTPTAAVPQNLADLADPRDLQQSANAPRTIDDVANPPGTKESEIAPIAMRAGLSGETVRIILSAGADESGKEAQFVRVNEHTWLVPRNTAQVIPLEAYQVLNDTLPPAADGGAVGFATPRFSVSMLERIPAPRQAA